MNIERIPPTQYPRVDYRRRAGAGVIDFTAVWLVSSLFGNNSFGIQILQLLIFIIAWMAVRVILPYNNQGQSLGRWAFDIKVLDFARGRIPDLQSLLKREAITCGGALLVSIALGNIYRNPTAILLVIPLAIDCGRSLSDTQLRQTWHDRYARTMIVSSHRGYSLDIKIRRLVESMRRNVRK